MAGICVNFGALQNARMLILREDGLGQLDADNFNSIKEFVDLVREIKEDDPNYSAIVEEIKIVKDLLNMDWYKDLLDKLYNDSHYNILFDSKPLKKTTLKKQLVPSESELMGGTILGDLLDANPLGPRDFLDRIFLTSDAKNLLLDTFMTEMGYMTVYDFRTGTRPRPEEINTRIAEFLERRFDKIKNYVKLISKSDFPVSTLFTERGSNVTKILEELIRIDSELDVNNWERNLNVDELYLAYLRSYEKKESQRDPLDNIKIARLEALNSLIFLTHFDDLLETYLGKWILSTPGHFNTPRPASMLKYNMKRAEGTHLNKNWSDEDKDPTSFELANDEEKIVIGLMPIYRKNGKVWEPTTKRVSSGDINFFILTIKGKKIRRNHSPRLKITISDNGTISGIRTSDLSIEAKEFLRLIKNRRGGATSIYLGELVSFNRGDSNLGLKTLLEIIFTNLTSLKGNLGLSDLEMAIIATMYKNIFESRTDSNNSVALFSNARDLYRGISSIFDIGSVVNRTQYKYKNGEPTVSIMSPYDFDRVSGELLASINANLTRERLKVINAKYKPVIDLTDYRDPVITFFIRTTKKDYKIEYHPNNNSNTADKRIYSTTNKAKNIENNQGWTEDFSGITDNSNPHGMFPFIYDILGSMVNVKSNKNLVNILRSLILGTGVSDAAVADYLMTIAIPAYAHAVAFNSIDLGDTYNVEIDGNNAVLNKVTDPYSAKVGELVYERNADDTFNKYIVVSDNTKVRVINGKKVFAITEQTDKGERIVKSFNGRERGYISAVTNDDDKTIVPFDDSVLKMTLTEFRKRVSAKKSEFYYRRVSPAGIKAQYTSFIKNNVNRHLGVIDVFNTKIIPQLDNLVNAIALERNLTTKNVMRTGENTNISVTGTNMLHSEREVFWALQGIDETGRYSSPLDTIISRTKDYKTNGDWESLLEDWYISREYFNGALLKLHKDFNLKESFIAGLVFDYLAPLHVNNQGVHPSARLNEVIRFVEAVNSDKTTVPLGGVLKKAVLTLKDKKSANFAIQETLGEVYGKVFNNVMQDCNDLTLYARENGKDIFPLLVAKYGDKVFEDLAFSIEDDYAALNDWCETYHEDLKTLGYTPLKVLNEFVRQYNVKHRTEPLTFCEEIHYRKADKVAYNKETNLGDHLDDHIEANLAFLQSVRRLTKYYLTEKFTNEFNESLKWIAYNHFLRKTGGDTEKADAYLTEWNELSDYDTFLKTNLNNFILTLLKNDVLLRIRDEKGDYFNWAINAGLVYGKVPANSIKYTGFYNSDYVTLGNIVHNGKILKQITKRTDLHGYTDEAGKRHIFVDGNGKKFFDVEFDINSGLYIDSKSEENKIEFDIHPMLELYNLRHFYFSQLNVLSTTGSHIWSDAKKEVNMPKEEGAKYFDFNKRNVVNTAANSLFKLGDVFGIPTKLNIAIIDDIKAMCIGINGDEDMVKPYDGMTRIDPFMMHWENASLDYNVTAATKKPIMFAQLPAYCAGFVDKTASFAITNQSMRTSEYDLRMMWKMTKHLWQGKTEAGYVYGDYFDIDITKSDEGDISFKGIEGKKETWLYYFLDRQDGRHYYRIDDIVKLDKPNTYDIHISEVDEEGNIIGNINKQAPKPITRVINSNYELWDVLGGFNSLEYNSDSRTLVDSENSIRKVANVASRVKTIEIHYANGKIETKQLTKEYVDDLARRVQNEKVVDLLNGVSVPEMIRLSNIAKSKELRESTNFVGTPMKEADIHIMSTKGAVKKGAGNINGIEKYTDNEDLNFMQVYAYDYGIQLDAEHEANKSVVSMMTQVISALADRGFTNDMALSVYQALSSLTAHALSENLGNFEIYFKTGNRLLLQNAITNIMVKEFMSSNRNSQDSDISRAITKRLIEEGKRGEILTIDKTKDALAFSDGSMFDKLLSTVSSIINKTAIKAKMFGTLSVLCPAHGIQQLLGDKRITDYKGFTGIYGELEHLRKNPIRDLSLIQLKRTYEIKYSDGTTKQYRIMNLADYYQLREELENEPSYEIVEKLYTVNPLEEVNYDDVKFGWYLLTLKNRRTKTIQVTNTLRNAVSKYGIDINDVTKVHKVHLHMRDLAPYNAYMKGSDGKDYCFYDLDSIKTKYELDTLLGIIKNVNKKGKGITFESISEYRDNLLSLVNTGLKAPENALTFTRYKYIDSIITKYFSVGQDSDLLNNLREAFTENNDADLKSITNQIKTRIADCNFRILLDLYNISLIDKIPSYLREENHINPIKLYNGKEIIPTEYRVNPYECLLPRIYAELFGLMWGDSLADIQSSFFFFKRALDNFWNKRVNQVNYDVSLKLLNGEHIYLKLNSLGQQDGVNVDLLNINKSVIGDKIYVRQPYSKKYESLLSSFNDELWMDNDTNTEIVVIKTSLRNNNLLENLKFYLDNSQYLAIELSDNLLNDTSGNKELVLKAIQQSKSKAALRFTKNHIQVKNEEIDFDKSILDYFTDKLNFINNLNTYLNPIINDTEGKTRELIAKERQELKKTALDSLYNSTNSKTFSILRSFAREQYTSFLKSLEFTAARIPAQSMQSFMAMKVAGFVEENVNNCFVCDDQIWLQGSDFDIDKATFMGYSFNEYGIFSGWSPYFSLYSYDHLQASGKLPFPTFKRLQVNESANNAFDFKRLLYSNENPDGILDEKYQLINKRTPGQIRTIARVLITLNEIVEKQRQAILADDNATDEQRNSILFNLNSTKEDKQIAEKIVEIFNTHNFINKNGKVEIPDEIDGMLKNYVSLYTYNISQDPANIPASLSPVDVASSPWKDLADTSSFGGSTSGSRPGDVSIYWSALEFNLTGKDVIGIVAANGVKVYYALTQVINLRLAKDDLNGLSFNVWFNGKNYKFLADAFVALSKNLDPQIKAMIEKNPLKADLMISGLLSLATDNAKELKLGKLNAGRDVAGLYLYGITIGVPIEELKDKLTSPTAIVIDRLMKGNILMNEYGQYNIKQAINYIVQGPPILGAKELIHKNNGKKRTFLTKEKWNKFVEKGKGIYDVDEWDGSENFPSLYRALADKESSLVKTILEATTSEEAFNNYLTRFYNYKEMMESALKEMEGTIDKKTSYSERYSIQRIRKNLSEIEDYIFTLYEIAQGSNKGVAALRDLFDIELLNDGYEEIGDIRMRVGLNLGVKTKFSEKLSFYENFGKGISKREAAIRRRRSHLKLLGENTSDLDGLIKVLDEFITYNESESGISKEILDEDPTRVSFEKYMSNPAYKAKVHEVYDAIKLSFNVYSVPDYLPHYHAYMEAAYKDLISDSLSAKFRIFNDIIMPTIKSIYKPTSRELEGYVRRGKWFIESVMINSFLRELPIMELVREGVDEKGNKKAEVERIQLGTKLGNAAFKTWMEEYFIPLLLTDSNTSDNAFIRDLTVAFNNLTLTKNKTLAYTLPIDMLPKSDADRAALSKYRVAFNMMQRAFTTLGKTYDITDLFFFYNLINYRNNNNMNSLTPLTETLVELNTSRTIDNYYKYIASFDRVNDFNFDTDDLGNKLPGTHFSLDDLYRALAPDEKEISITKARQRGIPYIRFYNNLTMLYELFKLDDDLVEEAKLNKIIRKEIIRDSYTDNPQAKLNELTIKRDAALADGKDENSVEVKKLNARIKALERTIDEGKNYDEYSDASDVADDNVNDENVDFGDVDADAVDPSDTADAMEGVEGSGYGEIEVDEETKEENGVRDRMSYFEINGYRPVDLGSKEFIRNTPYVSTIADPMNFDEGLKRIKVGNITTNIERTDNGKLRLSDIEVAAIKKKLEISNPIEIDESRVLGVDMEGNPVIKNNALASIINAEVLKVIEKMNLGC